MADPAPTRCTRINKKGAMRPINLSICLFVLFASIATPQDKKSIAVLDFDYSTVQSGASAVLGTNQDVGKGVADLIVEKLVKAGEYRFSNAFSKRNMKQHTKC